MSLDTITHIYRNYGMFWRQHHYGRYFIDNDELEVYSRKLLIESQEVLLAMQEELVNIYTHCCFNDMTDLAKEVLSKLVLDCVDYVVLNCIIYSCDKGFKLLLSNYPESKNEIQKALSRYSLLIISPEILILIEDNEFKLEVKDVEDYILLCMDLSVLEWYLQRSLIKKEDMKATLLDEGEDYMEQRNLIKRYLEEQV